MAEEQVPNVAEATEMVPEIPKRARGRPKGPVNRPKVVVIPLESETQQSPEPVESEAAKAEPERTQEIEVPPKSAQTQEVEPPPKRARKKAEPKPVEPIVMKSPPLDHHSVMRYLALHLEEQKKNEREAKVDHYTRLITRNRWL